MTVDRNRQLQRVLVTILAAVSIAFAAGGNAQMPGGRATKKVPDRYSILHAGKLLAVPGEAPAERRTVVVRNARIVAVESGFLTPDQAGVPADAEVVDLRERYVLPGLMDGHVHLTGATGAFAERRGARPDPDAIAKATLNALIAARLSLAAGFTTVRDLGSDDQSVFALRDAIDGGKLLGPTILASGPSISVTAGHGDDARSANLDERARAGVCDGADDCRRLTRHLEKIGADLIKIKITGGFSSRTGLDQHMLPAEMQAIVAAAHQRGLKVTAHGYTPDAVKDAIRAGIDSIEHGFMIDDEGLRMMKKAGVVLVPTLTIARPPSFVPEFVQQQSVRQRDEAAAFERAYRAGVKIVFGTDCGIYPHGKNADEFVTMVDKGMSAMDAIRSATIVAAELFGLDDAGMIATGMRADIIAVSGDPLADIAILGDVNFVMKGGRVAKRGGEMTTPLRHDLEHEY